MVKFDWVDLAQQNLSSLQHPLVFAVLCTETSAEPTLIESLSECSRSFIRDPIHFALLVGESPLRTFIIRECFAPTVVRADSVVGIALHSRRNKYVVFDNVQVRQHDLRERLQQLLEGSFRFSQLANDEGWPRSAQT